jgi:hypothetical protein
MGTCLYARLNVRVPSAVELFNNVRAAYLVTQFAVQCNVSTTACASSSPDPCTLILDWMPQTCQVGSL